MYSCINEKMVQFYINYLNKYLKTNGYTIFDNSFILFITQQFHILFQIETI